MWAVSQVWTVALCSQGRPQLPLNSLSNSRSHSSRLILFPPGSGVTPIPCPLPLYLWPFWVLENSLGLRSGMLPSFSLTRNERRQQGNTCMTSTVRNLKTMNLKGTWKHTSAVRNSFPWLTLSKIGRFFSWEVLSCWTNILVWDFLPPKRVRTPLKTKFVQ